MRYRRAWFFVAAAMIIGFSSSALLAAQASVWKGKITKDGDITVVQNPKEPMYPTGAIILKTELTIGGENTSGDSMIGGIEEIAVSSDDRIYVGDYKQTQVKIFGSDGKFIRAFGKAGQGPGEFLGPAHLSISENRKELFVDGLLMGSIFDLEGRFIKKFAYKKRLAGVKRDESGALVGILSFQADKDSHYELIKLTDLDAPGQVLAKAPMPDFHHIDPFFARPCWNISADGGIVEGYSARYEIRVHDAAGKVVRRIGREYDPVAVTDQEKADYLKNASAEVLAETNPHFASHHTAYRGIVADEKGRLFVQTWERSADGKKFSTDVFDSDGRYVAKIQDLGYVSVVLRDKLYIIDEDADGYPLVIRKALIWPKSGSQ